MGLTKRERMILQMANQGLSDYRIARNLSLTPSTVTRSHKSAQKKLAVAQADIFWAKQKGIDLSQFDFDEDQDR